MRTLHVWHNVIFSQSPSRLQNFPSEQVWCKQQQGRKAKAMQLRQGQLLFSKENRAAPGGTWTHDTLAEQGVFRIHY